MCGKILCSLAKSLGQCDCPQDTGLTIQPTSTKRIENEELRQLLHAANPSASIFLSDGSYLLCNEDDIKAFLAQDATNRNKYEAEAFDCDDFSYRLLGQFSVPGWSDLCLGIIWTDVHALNICVTEDKQILYIEPQSDELESTLLPWQGSGATLIVV
jgi:hypothetical protein